MMSGRLPLASAVESTTLAMVLRFLTNLFQVQRYFPSGVKSSSSVSPSSKGSKKFSTFQNIMVFLRLSWAVHPQAKKRE